MQFLVYYLVGAFMVGCTSLFLIYLPALYLSDVVIEEEGYDLPVCRTLDKWIKAPLVWLFVCLVVWPLLCVSILMGGSEKIRLRIALNRLEGLFDDRS